MDPLDVLLDLLIHKRWRLSACLLTGMAAIIALWWFSDGIVPDPGWRWVATAALFLLSALVGIAWEFGRPE
jgi:hypothetical protein